jgi:two-component system, NarL family, invasion response regulator UvrY
MASPPLSSKPITVLLVDDHPVVRDGYRRLLENTPDIRVAAEAGDGETACDRYAECTPDVVILDLSMPGIGGMETIRRIKTKCPAARILVFSMHDSETLILRALEAGATGYLTKNGGVGQMVEAVRQVARGEPFVDASHATSMIRQQLFGSAENPLLVLSAREFQIFQLSAEGHSVNDIAAMLSISPKTVGVHHSNIMKKLGLQNATQLVRLALRFNVIQP